MKAYLDYNATAPLREGLKAVMLEAMSAPANASSMHGFGRAAKKRLEDARKQVADAISVFPSEILFTSSGTEANNLALRGFPTRKLFVSAIEHPSVLKAMEGVELLPVDGQGVVRLEALEAALAGQEHGAALVSVMLANNETGVIQPISEISTLCRKYGALLHVDAVQGVGKLPLDMGLLGADMMTLSAHKAGGPVGVAALAIRQNIAIRPLLTGGRQELGRRAGTENIPAIAAFGALMQVGLDSNAIEQMKAQRDRLEAEILAFAPEVAIFGIGAPRLPNTSMLAMPGVASETQLMAFDLAGIAVSAGSACSSGRIEPSRVLKAMGVETGLAGNAIRVSLGVTTTPQEIDCFISEWKKLYTRTRKNAA